MRLLDIGVCFSIVVYLIMLITLIAHLKGTLYSCVISLYVLVAVMVVYLIMKGTK